jgi:hypothetical protein
MTLGEVALRDPRLACTLLRGDLVGCRGEIAYRGWEVVNLVARFTSIQADQNVEAKTLENICYDLWVREIRYTVRRPLFQAGSPWKGQWDYFNMKNPNIDVTLIIKSCCDYAIAPDPTPLENLIVRFECDCPGGLILTAGATFDSFFNNNRALEAGEVPTEVVVTFHAVRIPNGIYAGIDYQAAVEELRKLGYLPPKG